MGPARASRRLTKVSLSIVFGLSTTRPRFSSAACCLNSERMRSRTRSKLSLVPGRKGLVIGGVLLPTASRRESLIPCLIGFVTATSEDALGRDGAQAVALEELPVGGDEDRGVVLAEEVAGPRHHQ